MENSQAQYTSSMQFSRYAKKPNIKGKYFRNTGHGNIQLKFLSL